MTPRRPSAALGPASLSSGDTVSVKHLIRPVFTPRGASAPAIPGSRDSLQGLLALTVPVFMHETSKQIVGRAGQPLADECQLAASLRILSSSHSSSMSPHQGRPREKALYGAP
ncbi:unnamed protein product [Pleuronectes platessa]|uniref:Uncharacterized protein n=1 Tax=Pleuronectes platessa TaxID=8262 RepID=A0A9N7UGJ4_PLEPL|nr:unnamed protein product [Pleuronectes platessa]